MIMDDRYLEMTKRFGAYFQDLTLTIVGFVQHFTQPCQLEVIVELSKRCRLQKLTLDVGTITAKTSFNNSGPQKNTHLGALIGLVTNAFRLKSFHLKAWPLHQGVQNVDVLEALMANPKLQELERLDIFWQSAESSSWTTLNAILPAPDKMLDLVQHFRHLQSLGLRSAMLCEDVIVELAKPRRTPLKRLSVLVTYSRLYQEGVPEISCATWKKLRENSPELEVAFTILTRMPFVELAGFLKPEIPVSTLGFMKYSSLCPDDLVSISDKYAKTLRKFVSLVEVDHLDELLCDLVVKCPKLTTLVYHGSLQSQAVLDLAAAKGADWYRFDIAGKAIDFDPAPVDEFGEEVVVVRTADGQVQLADSLRYAAAQREERPREELLEELTDQVSQLIQQKWRPLGSEQFDF